jgi:hypothetical protein
LYRLRPEPKYLTSFYLMIAAGGALGGLFVAVIAPMIFTDYYEFHWSLFSCALLFLVVRLLERDPKRLNASVPAPEVAEGTQQIPHAAVLAAPEPGVGGRFPHWSERWLSCALLLVAIGGLDWYARHSMPQLVASVAAMADKSQAHHLAAILVGALHTIVNSKAWLVTLRVALWTIAGLLGLAWIVRAKFARFPFWRFVNCAWLGVGVVILGCALWKQAGKSAGGRVYTSRNFYGVFTIYEENKDSPQDHLFRLQHGRITHGLQLVDPDEAYLPTTYYGEASGRARLRLAVYC